MKIYLAYKLSNRDFEEVKNRLIEVDKIVKELGHEAFIFLRDVGFLRKIPSYNEDLVLMQESLNEPFPGI